MDFLKREVYKPKNKAELELLSDRLKQMGYSQGITDYTTYKLIASQTDGKRDRFGSTTDNKIPIRTLEEWFKTVTGKEWEEDKEETTEECEYPYRSIGWWLSCIDDEDIRRRALSYITIEGRILELRSSFYSAGTGAFTWAESKEAHSFWSDVFNEKTNLVILNKPKINSKSIINNSKTNKNEHRSNTSERKPILSQSSISISRGERYTGTERHCRTKKSGITSGSLSFREVTSH